MSRVSSAGWQTWRSATERALYAEGGFYRRPGDGPAGHFRTSVHASGLFAEAVRSLAESAGLATVVDVGAGRGELVRALRGLDPSLRLVAVERADRPADLPADVGWVSAMPRDLEALVVANEWLDNVPVDVVENTRRGPRLVEVDAGGRERLGRQPSGRDLAWLARWWPLADVGGRAEVGWPRDEAWASVLAGLRRGVAVAVDYSHTRDDRPAAGSLTGYRRGRQVPPVPDGSCDLTAHVALDACAEAGESAGATATRLLTQRTALQALGVRAVDPPAVLAAHDPAAYVASMAESGAAAELIDTAGLGGFGWLVQTVGLPLPAALLAG